MNPTLRKLAIVLTFSTALAVPVVAVEAHDNNTPTHWHDRSAPYMISSAVNSGQRAAINRAAARWTNGSRLPFPYTGLATGRDFTSDAYNLVFNGAIPSTWQGGCPPDATFACTRVRYTTGPRGKPYHLFDADWVLNTESHDFSTTDTNCELHLRPDVESNAVHEFGHFGHLIHSNDIEAVMHALGTDCDRALSQHDKNSMADNYEGH